MDFLREVCAFSGGKLAQEALAHVESEMKRQFDENQQAWNVIAELTRRMQIIDNAVRGTQRFINARQHHGQEYRKDKT